MQSHPPSKSNQELKTTRRDLLKSGAAGLGILACSCGQVCLAQRGGSYGGGGRGRGGVPVNVTPANPSLQHNRNWCRRCGDCSEHCRNVTTVYGRAVPAGENACTYCGQCTLICRNGALSERYHYSQVQDVLNRKNKIVIASTSPAIRVALGEMFRMTPGTNVEGKIVWGLRNLGVN